MWHTIFILFTLITLIIWTFPSFGQFSTGARKRRIRQLPNFEVGDLKNLSSKQVKPEQFSYSEMWPFIHMTPEEMLKEAQDLSAEVLLPVHWGKFSLAMLPWNEQIERDFKESKKYSIDPITPKIDETLAIGIDFSKTT